MKRNSVYFKRVFYFFLFFLQNYLTANTSTQNINEQQNSAEFIENKGQLADFDQKTRNEFLFYSKSEKLDIYFRKEGVTYIFKRGEDFPNIKGLTKEKEADMVHSFLNEKTLFYRLDFNFINPSHNTTIEGISQSDFYSNFYYSHCPNGILNVSSFKKIKYKNVYTGIDFEFYFNDGKIKYDIVLQPHANINNIKLQYNGAENIYLSNNTIKMQSPVGDIVEHLPRSFTINQLGKEKEIVVRYRLVNNIICFSAKHTPLNVLIIDPQITWTSYYDGQIFDRSNGSIDVKGGQCVIATNTYSNLFPTLNPGGSAYYVNTKTGSSDLGIVQFNTNAERIWATYFGGTSGELGAKVKIDYAGNILIIGITNSTNIPTQPAGGYYDASYNANYVYQGSYITKFNSSGMLLWSTHYDFIDVANLDIDLNNNVYVIAETHPGDTNLVAIPSVQTLAGAYNQAKPSLTAPSPGITINRSEDLYLIKFNSSTTRLWATNLGSTCSETPLDIHCGNDNYINILAIGDNYYGTSIVSKNAGGYYDNTLGIGIGGSSLDRWDALIYRFNPSGSLIWGTAFSGTKNDNVISYNSYLGNITTDATNNIYIFGHTESPDIPLTNPGGGAYYDNTFSGPGSDPYIAKFNSSTQLTWCTYIGTVGVNSFNHNSFIGFNSNNNLIFITTEDLVAPGSLPLVSRPGDYNAVKTSQTSVYIAEFNNNLNIAWSTYYSGPPIGGHSLGDAALYNNGCGYDIYMTSFWGKQNASSIDPPWISPGVTAYQDISFNLASGAGRSGLITRFSSKANPAKDSINSSICAGNSYLFNGQNLTTSGIYKDTLIASNGCDSILTLNLVVSPNVTSSFNDSICNGSSYLFNGQNITTPGTYKDTLIAAGGCDSIVTLNLNVVANVTGTFNQNICSGSSYLFNGQNLISSGIYKDTLTSIGGCDSIITLTLTVANPLTSSYSHTICSGNSYLFNGQNITTTGTYKDTLTAIGGCDSVVTLNLIVNNSSLSSFNHAICLGNSYLFNGQNLITSGTYKDTLTSITGCDSVITLNLSVINPSTSSFNHTVCFGSSYLYNGQNLTAAGAYKDTLVSAAGCDSIVTLNLNVLPGSSSIQTISTCSASGYTLPNGIIIYTSGVYIDTMSSANGCDSVITYNITINTTPTASISNDTTIVQGASVTLTAIGGGTYNWTPVNGLNSSTNASVIATPDNTTTYCVIVMATNGCADTACVTVTVEKNCSDIENVILPNAFSPNNDNVNDMFCFQNWNDCIKDFSIVIFDRWGEKVYESNSPDFCWDGYYQSKIMDAQVFVYYINATNSKTGKKLKRHGNISLIR